jgi:predicted ArsR family transcriptional regulator
MANGNGNGKVTKGKVVALLNERPVGLTIREIAVALDTHRQTIAKYVLVLEAEGLIHRRVIGSATIHYPKKVYDRKMTSRTRPRSKKKV